MVDLSAFDFFGTHRVEAILEAAGPHPAAVAAEQRRAQAGERQPLRHSQRAPPRTPAPTPMLQPPPSASAQYGAAAAAAAAAAGGKGTPMMRSMRRSGVRGQKPSGSLKTSLCRYHGNALDHGGGYIRLHAPFKDS